MMKFSRITGALPLALLIAIAFVYLQTEFARTAPDAHFTTLKGHELSLTDLRGKPTLVTFWATDCPGCIEEIPHLIQLQQTFGPSGLTIIAVAMDYDPPNHVVAMAEQKQLPYHVVLDPDSAHARAFGNVRLTPTTFLIDRQGRIVLQKVGVFDPDDMQKRLQAL